MKNILLYLSLVFVIQTSLAQYTSIPDPNFEAHLEAFGMGDGIDDNQLVLTANINSVTSLDVSALGITDLTGIEDFIALEGLGCHSNNLTSLDFSQNLNLEVLVCSFNFNLSNLNVTQNTELRLLACFEANLSTLDLSNNNKLEELYCYDNLLKSLNITSPHLWWLDCSINQLTSLDVTSCTELYWLDCYTNQLSFINISQNILLENFSVFNNNLSTINLNNNLILTSFYCDFNNLTIIDVSQNILLDRFGCSYNNIMSLDLSQNSLLTQFICSNNPNLSFLDLRNGANENIFQFFATDTNLDCIMVDDAVASYLEDWHIDENTIFVNNEQECEDLSVNDLNLDSFLIYPNPASEIVFISTNTEAVYKFMDINGKTIKNGILNKSENFILLSDIVNGVYFIKLVVENNTITKKIIKR